MTPSTTIDPATKPSLETRNTFRTSALPSTRSTISGSSIPFIASSISVIASYITSYPRTSMPCCFAIDLALGETDVLNAMMIAFELLASKMSDSDTVPTPEPMTLTFTSSMVIGDKLFSSASTDPLVSPFMTTLSSLTSPCWIWAYRSSSVSAFTGSSSRVLIASWRFMLTSRASRSFLTAMNESPASGTPLKPNICTGVDGPAFLTRLPLWLRSERTLPCSLPTTNTSPISNVPCWTRTVQRIPIPSSFLDSITTPCARVVGSAWSSSSSACKRTISSSLSMPSPVFAETSASTTSPP